MALGLQVLEVLGRLVGRPPSDTDGGVTHGEAPSVAAGGPASAASATSVVVRLTLL